MKITEKIKDLRAKKIKELADELSEKRVLLAMASLKVKAGKLADISAVKKLKKDIARIYTLINEKNRSRK